ncbi:DUF3107 domain-containing protein [Cnuibacter sp. UC19_7]|uniref:DUF3107 domain-containing protein n=1 Tax=Cnuibacter sp. UC19_7 TaxID=3350166 RepID=UPI00366BDCF4
MDIRIGIANSPRELTFESAQSAADIERTVSEALASKATHVSLSDEKGRLFVVPTAALTYVEIGSEEARRVGFVA